MAPVTAKLQRSISDCHAATTERTAPVALSIESPASPMLRSEHTGPIGQLLMGQSGQQVASKF